MLERPGLRVPPYHVPHLSGRSIRLFGLRQVADVLHLRDQLLPGLGHQHVGTGLLLERGPGFDRRLPESCVSEPTRAQEGQGVVNHGVVGPLLELHDAGDIAGEAVGGEEVRELRHLPAVLGQLRQLVPGLDGRVLGDPLTPFVNVIQAVVDGDVLLGRNGQERRDPKVIVVRECRLPFGPLLGRTLGRFLRRRVRLEQLVRVELGGQVAVDLLHHRLELVHRENHIRALIECHRGIDQPAVVLQGGQEHREHGRIETEGPGPVVLQAVDIDGNHIGAGRDHERHEGLVVGPHESIDLGLGQPDHVGLLVDRDLDALLHRPADHRRLVVGGVALGRDGQGRVGVKGGLLRLLGVPGAIDRGARLDPTIGLLVGLHRVEPSGRGVHRHGRPRVRGGL